MKQLGDSYARAEFKAHKSSKIGQASPPSHLGAAVSRSAEQWGAASHLPPSRAFVLAPDTQVPRQVKQFAAQWKEYVVTLEIQAQKGAFGRDLDQSRMGKMNEEQLENLRRLEEEARKIGTGGT